MTLTNKTYDALKWIAQILLPALSAVYFGLAGIWGLPYAEQVVGTLAVLDTFLGVLLGLSSSKYTKAVTDPDGVIMINSSDPSKDVATFQFNKDWNDIAQKKTITMTIDRGV